MDYRKYLIAAAMAAAAVPATAAPVNATDDADGEVLILVPLQLLKVEDLDFGAVVPSAVSGFVSINATTGARLVGGGVSPVPSDVGQRAYFAGAGSPGQQVIVSVNAPAELTSTTDSTQKIPVLALSIEGAPLKTIDPVTKSFFFGVGGIIMIGANQPEGIYQETFQVTANYL